MSRANAGYMIVPSGAQTTHLFDLWGVLVDAQKLGGRKLERFEEVARARGMDAERIAQAMGDYDALLRGEPWATGPRKGAIIDAVESHLKQYEDARGVVAGVNYDGIWLQDAVEAARAILDGGEHVSIFTSKPAEWVRATIDEDLGARIGRIHAGNKGGPEAFVEVARQERGYGAHVVSHTADELPELLAARESGLFAPTGLIYIDRNGSNAPDKIRGEGLIYIPGRTGEAGLRSVDYDRIAKKT